MDEALDLLEQNRAADPHGEFARACLLVLAKGKADKDQLDRLENIMQAALERLNRPVPMLLAVADLRSRRGRYADAEAAYREVLQKQSANPVALNNLAVMLALQGVKLDESLKLVNQAIDTAGLVPQMRDSRACVYLAMGQTKEALKDLEDALADTESPVWLFHQARAYDQDGQRSEAVASMQRALKKGLTAQMLQPAELPAFEKLRQL